MVLVSLFGWFKGFIPFVRLGSCGKLKFWSNFYIDRIFCEPVTQIVKSTVNTPSADVKYYEEISIFLFTQLITNEI